ELADLTRELADDLRAVGGFAVDHRALVQPPLADQPLDQADPRRAPESVALAVARRLGDLARVEPVQQRLLADPQLVSDLERRQILHAHEPTKPVESWPLESTAS